MGSSRLRTVMLTISICLVGAAVYFSGQNVAAKLRFRNIEIDSQLTSDQLADLKEHMRTSADPKGSIHDIKAMLDSIEWISTSQVKWGWPDRVRVTVEPHEAVARWNNDFFLDAAGIRFQSPFTSGEELPELVGPPDSEKMVMWQYQQLAALLMKYDLSIQSLVLDETGSWSFALTSGIDVRIGKNEIFDRIQRLVRTLDKIETESRPIASIDLRYANGFAVGWEECTYGCNDLALKSKL